MANGKPEDKSGEQGYTRIASTSGVSAEEVAKLLDQIEGLKAALADETTKRGEAEARALAAAEAQGTLLQPGVEEIPTGRTRTMKRVVGYRVVDHKEDGRDILRPDFDDVEEPTYFYKIDLPPSGGIDCKINGVPLYHGAVVELDIHTLRSVKEIVYRAWDHERNITGSNENFYRPKQANVLRGRAA